MAGTAKIPPTLLNHHMFNFQSDLTPVIGVISIRMETKYSIKQHYLNKYNAMYKPIKYSVNISVN